MRKVLFLLLLCAAPLMTQAQLFEPGNVIFADPFYSPDGQIVELKITGNEAEVINVVRWDLGDTDRRRALGLDVDPSGNVWVGLTAAYGDDSEFPEGIGEILRIDSQGNQQIFQTDITKVTFLTAVGTDEVIIQSNVATDNFALGYKVENGEVVDSPYYEKTGYGEALLLPDGRLLMGDHVTGGILLFDKAGGASTGMFSEVLGADGNARTVRSLTYNNEIGAVIASLQDQHTFLRINLNGEIEEEYNGTADGFTGVWGVAQIPGTTQFITGNHNVADLANTLAIFDANDLAAGPRLIEITSGFEQAGLEAGTSFQSFFNIAVVPGAEFPVGLAEWQLF